MTRTHPDPEKTPRPHLHSGEGGDKELSPAATRALAEAAERRAALDARAAALGAYPEQGGRGGLDPVRYEDWEFKGRAIDF